MSGLETSSEESRNRGCVFSPPCSLLFWASVFTAGLLTGGAGGQNYEGLLAAANASGQEGAGHLMDLFGLPGSEELVTSYGSC